MSGSIDKQVAFRNRSKPVKKWTRNEEIALIKYLKDNRDFEKPISRIYYNTFLAENGINCDFKTVRSKVRNMRSSYRRAKEYEINKLKSNDMDLDIEAVRREMLKICWFLDDFDDIFPNEMDNYTDKTQPIPEFEDDFSNQEEYFSNKLNTTHTNQEEYFSNKHNTTNTNNININEDYNIKDASSTSSSSKGMEDEIFTVQKDLFNLKRRKHSRDNTFRKQELDLYKERLNFEKEKFDQEVRLKEKEIESQERVKIMELQMKERIAMKELELKEKLALKSMQKEEINFNNSYHHIT